MATGSTEEPTNLSINAQLASSSCFPDAFNSEILALELARAQIKADMRGQRRVAALLSRGADPCAIPSSGTVSTATHIAASRGLSACLRLLVWRRGVEALYVPTVHGWSPLLYASGGYAMARMMSEICKLRHERKGHLKKRSAVQAHWESVEILIRMACLGDCGDPGTCNADNAYEEQPSGKGKSFKKPNKEMQGDQQQAPSEAKGSRLRFERRPEKLIGLKEDQSGWKVYKGRETEGLDLRPKALALQLVAAAKGQRGNFSTGTMAKLSVLYHFLCVAHNALHPSPDLLSPLQTFVLQHARRRNRRVRLEAEKALAAATRRFCGMPDCQLSLDLARVVVDYIPYFYVPVEGKPWEASWTETRYVYAQFTRRHPDEVKRSEGESNH